MNGDSLPRKVLILAGSFPPRRGGVPQSLAALCRHFDPAKIAVLTSKVPGDAEADQALPYPVFRHDPAISKNLVSGAPVRLGWGLARYFGTLLRVVRRVRPDVIFSFNCGLQDVASGVALRMALRIPYAAYVHGEDIPTPVRCLKKDHLRLPLLGRADLILTNSDFSLKRIEALGYGAGKTRIISAGISTDLFAPGDGAEMRRELGIGAEDPVLLTVGRLDLRKGHDVVIGALPLLRQEFPALRYVIVGEGPEREKLAALAREKGVAERVLFAGFQPDERLRAYYRVCDVFVMHNRTLWNDVEGFGLVFLEAGACGKPVIGGRSGGVVDAIIHGKTGFLVAPDDSQALIQALQTLLRDSALRREMGLAGRRRAVEEFSNRGQAAKMWQAFTELARARSRPREKARVSSGGVPNI
jgi:phosphatidyl-myo-inositol dimannoside synthase